MRGCLSWSSLTTSAQLMGTSQIWFSSSELCSWTVHQVWQPEYWFMWRCFWAQCRLWKACFMFKTFHMQGGEGDRPCSAMSLAKFPRLILLHQERQPFPNPHFKMMKFCLGNIKTNSSHFFMYEHSPVFIDGLKNWLVWQVLKPHVPWVRIQRDGAQYTGSPGWPTYSSEPMEIFKCLVIPGSFCW